MPLGEGDPVRCFILATPLFGFYFMFFCFLFFVVVFFWEGFGWFKACLAWRRLRNVCNPSASCCVHVFGTVGWSRRDSRRARRRQTDLHRRQHHHIGQATKRWWCVNLLLADCALIFVLYIDSSTDCINDCLVPLLSFFRWLVQVVVACK
jgi:hypothetical protein